MSCRSSVGRFAEQMSPIRVTFTAIACALAILASSVPAYASGESQGTPGEGSDGLPAETEANPPVLVGAGNIATCGDTMHEETARLLDSVVAETDATVMALGDNAYETGSLAEFEECYEPTWGRHRDRTRPAPGNWEYATPGAAGYFEYFGDRAGDPTKGYYSYSLGDWHIVVLNTDCINAGGCGPESPQATWLRADLAQNARQCTLAYGHHPRFSSSREVPSHPELEALWTILGRAGTSVYVAAHSHHYERFAPQTSVGVASETAIRQFVVGTGGRPAHVVGTPLANSEVIADSTYGVLKLTLHPDRYAWEFLSTPTTPFTDSGEALCGGIRQDQVGMIARSSAPFLMVLLPFLLLLIPILFRPPRYRVN
jgi:acid phosphatase type 7